MKKIALKIFPFILLIIIVTFSFILPEVLYYSNMKSIVNSEISNGRIVSKSVNSRTREYLKSHENASVESVTDFQGSDNNSGYLVVGLKDNSSIGVFVTFKEIGPYLTNYQITKVKLND